MAAPGAGKGTRWLAQGRRVLGSPPASAVIGSMLAGGLLRAVVRRVGVRTRVSVAEASGSLPGDGVIPHPMVVWTRRGGALIRGRPDPASYLRVEHVGHQYARVLRSMRRPRRAGTYVDFTWALVLDEHPGHRTRLLVRTRATYAPRGLRLLVLPLGLFDAPYGVATLRAIARRAARKAGHITEAVRRPANASLVTFFGLVVAISIPFWVLGALGDRLPNWFPENLPVSALMVFNPMIAAAILVYRKDGSGGLKRLLKRAIDFERITNRIWYLPVLLQFPVVMLPLSYAVMRLLDLPLPEPHFTLAAIPVLVATYFAAAIGEELGWTGYALDPLQDRWGALAAAVVLGAFGAAWHLIPFMQGGNSAAWIAGQCLFTMASRVIIVWLYNNTGHSVFAAVVLHTTSNVSWNVFPNNGSHYDPVVTGVIMTVLAVIAVVGWGPRTLAGRVTSA